MKPIRAGLLALGALCSQAAWSQAQAPGEEPKTADYSVDTRLRIMSDRRVGGVSETFRKPGAELHMEAAHASGLVGVAELATVSKFSYPAGDGYTVLLAGGYRWGDPDRWHFGVGAAHEMFPGSQVKDAPTGFDVALTEEGLQLTPTGVLTFDFDTSYALFEFGFGALEARYLYVVSKDFRGANTASVCGQFLDLAGRAGDLAGVTNALNCYTRGDLRSRGTQLLDVDYKYSLDGRTSLLAHAGIKRVKNFSEADMTDWRLGVQHKRWGVDWIAEVVGANTKFSELYSAVGDGGEVRKLDNTKLVLTLSYTF